MIILCAECALSFYNSGVFIKEKTNFHNDPTLPTSCIIWECYSEYYIESAKTGQIEV
jgi:hypothetical protein